VPPAVVPSAAPAAAAASGGVNARRWTGSWETAPSGTAPALPDASIRSVVHLSIGGRAVRVRLSNRLGSRPLLLDSVTVALRAPGASGNSPAAAPGSLRTVTFDGASAVTVPVGEDAVSDPVRLRVLGGGDLLVSVHTPVDSGPATYHRTALRTNFVARHGNWTTQTDGTAYTSTLANWYYLTGVDVLGAAAAGSVVAFGDSITDGTGSTPDTDRRWPDRLAARLRALPPQRRLGVLNAGIAGNRLLRSGVGPSALARLDADALSRAGVRALVLLEGINDIKGVPAATDPAAFAQAYRTIVARAHARGIRVVGATLTPCGGYPSCTPENEAVRQAVNAVVRGAGIFDAVADFDAAVRDPDRPDRILPGYDPGDHLHFNDAGMRALAATVDPAALTG
jgi:lysophospholipase L1-like esterase